jgi:hypothetical protein
VGFPPSVDLPSQRCGLQQSINAQAVLSTFCAAKLILNQRRPFRLRHRSLTQQQDKIERKRDGAKWSTRFIQ